MRPFLKELEDYRKMNPGMFELVYKIHMLATNQTDKTGLIRWRYEKMREYLTNTGEYAVEFIDMLYPEKYKPYVPNPRIKNSRTK